MDDSGTSMNRRKSKEKKEGKSSTGSNNKKGGKRKTTKDDIAKPENFQHLGYISRDVPSSGFDVNNMEMDGNLKKLPDLVGVTEDQMQKEETMDFIYDFAVEKRGGIENVTREIELERKGSPVAPAPSAPSRGQSREAPPPTAPSNVTREIELERKGSPVAPAPPAPSRGQSREAPPPTAPSSGKPLQPPARLGGAPPTPPTSLNESPSPPPPRRAIRDQSQRRQSSPDESQKEVQKLEQRVKELEEDVNHQSEKSQKKVQKLEQRNEELNHQNEKSQKEVQKLEQRIKELEEDINHQSERSQKELQKLEQRKEELDHQNEKSQKEVQKLAQRIKELEEDINHQNEKSQKKVQKLEQRNEELNHQNERYKKKTRALEKRRIVLEAEILEQRKKLNYADELDQYEMGEAPRGICLIINNFNFFGEEQRHGAKADEEAIGRLFNDLHFKVEIRQNLGGLEIQKIAQEIAARDHSKHAAFVFCIMSHGDKKDVICGVDNRKATMEGLMSEFTPTRCPTLENKPKLFFIQACRGQRSDLRMSRLSASTDNIAEDCIQMIHYPDADLANGISAREADFLLAFATVPGYKAWRSKQAGSWFIQILVDVIRRYHRHHHLLDMLTEVNKRVADIANEHPDVDLSFQVPSPTHTLRAQVFL